MKIEMGESLLRSYFKDVKGCLITQTNWKTDSADSAQLQDIYKKIRSDSDFSDVFKTELAQTLRQAEVDVIGIDAGGKVYMAEVAFHEGGLNYGGKNETKDRVVKKLLRAYLAATKFFPGHAYEILFASPKVNPATDEIIKAYFAMLSDRFESQTVHFAYYANDGFRDEILVPTYRRTKAEADTSDLFIRSVRMLDMFALVNEEQTPLARKGAAGKTHQKKLSEQSAKTSNQIKVGEIARSILRPLLESGKVSTGEIEKLKDADYCKMVFGLYVPMLIPYCGKTVYRYYSNPVSIHGKQYLLTNDWYEDENRHNREPLQQWIAKYEDNKPTNL